VEYLKSGIPAELVFWRAPKQLHFVMDRGLSPSSFPDALDLHF